MPPNDDLFAPDPSPSSPQPDQSVAPEAGGAKLAEQLASLTATFGKLADAQAQTNARIEQLASTVARPANESAAVEEEAPATDASGRALTPEQQKFAKFYDDPEAFIAKAAGEMVKRELGPHLRLQAEQQAETLEAEQRARIDSIFGEGTWEAEYQKDFLETVGKLPLEMRASRKHIEAGVAAIHGRKDLTPAAKAELEKRRQNVEKARAAAAAPAMLGNGMPAPRSRAGELSADEQEFLAKLGRNGIPYTREQYLAARERGNTETAWKQPKGGKGAAGATKGA